MLLEQLKNISQKYQVGGNVKYSDLPYDEADIKNFYKTEISSPWYRQRLIDTGYGKKYSIGVDGVIKKRLDRIENAKLDNVQNNDGVLNQLYRMVSSLGKDIVPSGSGSYYNPDTGNITIVKSQLDNLKVHPRTVLAHEYGHAEMGRSMTDSDRELLEKYKKDAVYGDGEKGHDQNPFENKSDINTIRYNLYRSGIFNPSTGKYKTKSGKFEPSLLEKVKDDGAVRRLRSHYDDSTISQILNTIAQNSDDSESPQYAQVGGTIKSELDQLVQKFQDGGKIVSELWKETTGLDWAEAKKQGLTDGSYKKNMALRDRLIKGENPVKPKKKPHLIVGELEGTPIDDQGNETGEFKIVFSDDGTKVYFGQNSKNGDIVSVDGKNYQNSTNQPEQPGFWGNYVNRIGNQLSGSYNSAVGILRQLGNEYSQYPNNLVKETSKNVLGYDYGPDSNFSYSGLAEYGMNGIKRKITKFTQTDDGVETGTPANGPLSMVDYYKKYSPSGNEIAYYDVPNNADRRFKSQMMDTEGLRFGYRNRGDYKEFNSEGLDVTSFNHFEPAKNLRLSDSNSVIGVDARGNLVAGTFGEFKNRDDVFLSRTFANKVVGFKENNGSLVGKDDAVHDNKGYNVPVVQVLGEDGKLTEGALNVLYKPGKENVYGSIQGGRVLVQNPDTKKNYIIAGSVQELKNRIEQIKGKSKYVNVFTLDNGTYSRGLSFKDNKFTADRLRSYDNENSSGGNGLYIVENTQPVKSRFKTEYYQSPSIRTTQDESYKKGHPLKNEAKAIVLHYTAYEDGPSSDKQLHEQFMGKNQNNAHLVVLPDGTKRIYASPEQVTFHAGESEWRGRKNVNDFGIGIEFQNNGKKPLTQAQIESAGEYISEMMNRYNIKLDDVVTHAMIAPGRKDDLTQAQYKQVLDYLKKSRKK